MSDPSDTDIDADTDSPILRELRAENKRLKKLAEELPNQVRGQVQREFTASKLLDDAGYPKLAPLFLEKHTNDEPTAEAVAEWLGGFGLEPRTGGPVVDTSGLAQTVTFADRVAAKAAEPRRAVGLGGGGRHPRRGRPVVPPPGLARTVTFADRVAPNAADPLRAVEEQ